MKDSPKNRFSKKPANKVSPVLTPSELLKHAESIIRFDSETAIRAQHGLTDLVSPSNDKGESPKTTSLEVLCGNSGGVKVKSDAKTPANVFAFTIPKKD